jgi:hypothetical protein
MSQLSPQPKFTATTIDSNGYVVPLVGGKLFSYVAGSSTPKDTYTDSTAGVANTNPVVLDVNGQAGVWLNGAYKLVLKDPADVVQWTVDNIADMSIDQTFTNATLAGALTVTSTAITWSGNPTHSGNHTFTNNVVINGNATIGDSNADTFTVKPDHVTWTNNPIHSGNHTFSGKISIGDYTGNVGSGTYTPTLTNTANISSSTANLCQYMRIGNMVTVSGVVYITPTSGAAALTQLGMSLPIASAFVNDWEALAGTFMAYLGTSTPFGGSITADKTNDRATFLWRTPDASPLEYAFQFTYKIL